MEKIVYIEVLPNGLVNTTLMDQNRNVLDFASYDTNNETVVYQGETYPVETVIYDEEIEEVEGVSENPWTPVYMATYSKKMKDIVGDVQKFGTYSVVMLAGLGLVVTSMGISAPVVISGMKVFIASSGFAIGSNAIGSMIGGKWSYKLYRTKGAVFNGYGYGTMYRHQSATLTCNFKFGKFKTPTYKYVGKPGSWWSASKPYKMVGE